MPSKTWAANGSRPTGEAAIDVLGRSLSLYAELGPTWDARRVRSRLRRLDGRRRVITSEPETHGWAALTQAELAAARLVADGLTNREVAESLFVSPRTVNSHLRQVFTKLGVNSRVDLARLAHNCEMAWIVRCGESQDAGILERGCQWSRDWHLMGRHPPPSADTLMPRALARKSRSGSYR